MGFPPWILMLILLLIAAAQPSAAIDAGDAAVMQSLRQSLNGTAALGWNPKLDPCQWEKVSCDSVGNRVTLIQIGNSGLEGTLPPSLNKLTELQIFEVYQNNIGGAVPSLSGLSSLQRVMLRDNQFTSMPPDFFDGMTSLNTVILDYNKMLSPWSIPDSLKSATSLNVFSAVSTNLGGPLPEFLFTDFSNLQQLKLSFNNLEGGLPSSLQTNSQMSILWLNPSQDSTSKLNGTIAAIQNMPMLSVAWLHGNSFSGPLPDFSNLTHLVNLTLRDNQFTGLVPESLVNIPSLFMVNLTNNLLQGPTPKFADNVISDLKTGGGKNSFCLPDPGTPCDKRVSSLLDVARDVGYPSRLATSWTGNNPCNNSWTGITCQNDDIVVVNFNNFQLAGTISPSFASIGTLQKLLLSNNNLTGTIPPELTNLNSLQELDVSNNELYGPVPTFSGNQVKVITSGNARIGMDAPPPTGDHGGSSGGTSSGKKKSSTGVILGSVVGVGAAIVFAGLLVLFVRRSKRKGSSRVQAPSAVVIHPQHSGSDQDTVKITIAGPSFGGTTRSENYSHGSSETSNIHVLETNGLKIQIEVLRRVTKNFSEENVLGRGGFGTVYKGDLDDGTTIAVKRMESGVMNDKGLEDFQSEIAIVTKVRHRHLVALLGFCLDAGERIFVYEYMSQGALSRHLFDWKEEQLKPLDWMKRLIIALDVARGVEYLHSLAQHSFIHRDLKPANILLGDDLRAKVADFGLIRLVPDGKASVATKLAGTFGYLAPEYAVMGRVTTKLDVYSFGVILMELISGRKSLDETLPAESSHLVTWFRRVLINKELPKVVDPTIELNEEILASVHKVAELAGHCCANEPHQRPDMSHAVVVLSSLTEIWKPSETDPDDPYGIDYDMPLPQAVKKWQALEGMSSAEGSSYFGSNDNTQTSIPTRPSGFADSFTSSDGR